MIILAGGRAALPGVSYRLNVLSPTCGSRLSREAFPIISLGIGQVEPHEGALYHMSRAMHK